MSALRTVDGVEIMESNCFKVVINHEEQYAIWPARRDNALGWRDAGVEGLKEECLAYIRDVWTDMRPLSLRMAMAGRGRASAVAADAYA